MESYRDFFYSLVSPFDIHDGLELDFLVEDYSMIRSSAKVVNNALSLPPRSRAKLAEKLLESLDDPKQKEFDSLWREEVEDRIDAYDKGSLKAVPGKEVFRNLKPRKQK
jgi:putative addiction module component (TIGR02574 family)